MPFNIIAAARDLVAADTVSARGNAAVIPVVTRLAGACGLPVELLPEGPRNANLLIRLPGAPARDPLLFVTHTDTVDAGPRERWTATDPWTLRVDGDRLYGLGAADTKLDLLAKLAALERLSGRSLSRGVALLGTFGEEIGLLGAKSFVRGGLLRPRAVACGEPSSLRIVHAHKGYLVARVRLPGGGGEVREVCSRTFTGKAAHSARPLLGENAIEKALVDPLAGVVRVRGGQGANSVPASCEVGLASGPSPLPLDAIRRVIARWHALVAALEPRSDGRFSPPETVSNVGLLDASPAGTEILLDARLLPGHEPARLARAYEEEVRALGGAVVFERDNPAVWTDPEGPLVSAARATSRALGLSDAPVTKATNTEAAAFAGLCEAIVFGPGESTGNAHSPNEYGSLSQILRAADWYERLVLELCA